MAIAGVKRVQIFAARVTSPAVPGKFGKTREQYLPARYNTQSELTAKVRPDGDNRLSYDLTGE